MVVERKACIIATKERPIVFIREDGDVTDCIEDAVIYNDYEEARRDMYNFDEPENYTVIEGNIVFSI